MAESTFTPGEHVRWQVGDHWCDVTYLGCSRARNVARVLGVMGRTHELPLDQLRPHVPGEPLNKLRTEEA